MGDGLIPATPSPRFTRFFAGYCRRMLARSFSNVRVTVGTPAVLRSLDGHDGPAIAAINHASWWDPLVGLVLADGYAPSRVLASPIEADQLRKFRFMRKIGLFGIDPADRGSYRVFVEHACSLFEREPRTLHGCAGTGTPAPRGRGGRGAAFARGATSPRREHRVRVRVLDGQEGGPADPCQRGR